MAYGLVAHNFRNDHGFSISFRNIESIPDSKAVT